MEYLTEYVLRTHNYLESLKNRCTKVGPDSKKGMEWKKQYIMSHIYDISDAYEKPSSRKKEAWRIFREESEVDFKWARILSYNSYSFTIGEEIFDPEEFRIYLHIVTHGGDYLTWWDLSGIRDGKTVDIYKAGQMRSADGCMEAEVIIKMDFDASQPLHNVIKENIAKYGICGKYRADHVFVQDILYATRNYINPENWVPSEKTFMPMPPSMYEKRYIRGVFYNAPVSYLPGATVYCGEFDKDLQRVCGGRDTGSSMPRTWVRVRCRM